MFKKKFKVRVKKSELIDVFDDFQYYYVEYAYFWAIPIYNKLSYFNCQHWMECLYHVDEAEMIANTLHSMEDVKKFHEESIKKADEYFKNKPYDVKYFK